MKRDALLKSLGAGGAFVAEFSESDLFDIDIVTTIDIDVLQIVPHTY